MKTLHLYVTVWFIELFLFVVAVSISQIIFLNFKHLNLFFIFLIWIFLLNMRFFWRNESGVTCFALRGIIACYLPWYLPKIASQIILFIFFLSLGSQLCCYNHQSCLSFYNVFLYYHVEPIFLKSQSLKKKVLLPSWQVYSKHQFCPLGSLCHFMIVGFPLDSKSNKEEINWDSTLNQIYLTWLILL